MFLGGYDKDYYVEKMNFHKVVRKSWWTLGLEKVLINGVDSELCGSKTHCEIIMDTGASLMATPPQMYSKFIDLISKGSKCSDLKSFPTVTF